MKRPIKFRGKRIDNGEWVYGDFISDGENSPNKDLGFIMPPDASSYDRNNFIAISLKTLGQFTGLKDKNGKEIYEGDIVSSKPKDSQWNLLICKIDFNEKTARFEAQQYWKNKSEFLSLSSNNDYYEYEIIGNIFEHPELLHTGALEGN